MTQPEQTKALKTKKANAEAYTKTLLYEGVRLGKISKKHLESFQKNLGALLSQQISHYTHGGTSVKTEIAQNLTSSIFYTLDATLSQSEDTPTAIEKLQSTDLHNLFKEGLTQLNQEFNQSRLLYSRMKGNKLDVDVYAYNITINEGIPLFFKAYNPEFSADEAPGSLEYLPVYYQKKLTGIHYMKDIIHNLYLENLFCSQFSIDEIKLLLTQFAQNAGYPSKDLTDNIFAQVMNNAIAKNLLKSTDDTLLITKNEALKIAEMFEGQSSKICKDAVAIAVDDIIVKKSLRWPSLKTYLEKSQDKTVAGLYRSVKQENTCVFLAVR